jgi:hypothetical protein
MRVLVCGDRNWNDQRLIEGWLDRLYTMHPEGVDVIEGGAAGADSLAHQAAMGLGIECKSYPANWAKYGRAAGPIRNKWMLVAGKPDLVLAFHDDLENSKGTKNMIEQAKKAGVRVQVVTHSDKLVK